MTPSKVQAVTSEGLTVNRREDFFAATKLVAFMIAIAGYHIAIVLALYIMAGRTGIVIAAAGLTFMDVYATLASQRPKEPKR
jgi:hypothetical protein